MGRAWESAQGNLAATLLLRPARPVSEWPQLSFAAAIAVADMAAHFAPQAVIAVKWPNDVLVAGKPQALGHPAGDGRSRACHRHRGQSGGASRRTEFPAISLKALGVTAPAPCDALGLLACNFAGWYDIWRSQGFAPLRDAWLARAAGLGHRIRARLPDRERLGVFEGIDAEGALLLNEGNGARAIAAGEVFFGHEIS